VNPINLAVTLVDVKATLRDSHSDLAAQHTPIGGRPKTTRTILQIPGVRARRDYRVKTKTFKMDIIVPGKTAFDTIQTIITYNGKFDRVKNLSK